MLKLDRYNKKQLTSETYFCVSEIEHKWDGKIQLCGYRKYSFRPDFDFAYALKLLPNVLMADYGTKLPVPAFGEARGNLVDKDVCGNLVFPPVVYVSTLGDRVALVIPILQRDAEGNVTEVTRIILEGGSVADRMECGRRNLTPSLN